MGGKRCSESNIYGINSGDNDDNINGKRYNNNDDDHNHDGSDDDFDIFYVILY